MIFQLQTLEQLPLIAAQLLNATSEYRVIAFRGEMGAGKTTLIKAMCRILGVRDNVSSPTFSIVNEYLNSEGDTLYHFDFYRIDHLQEAADMGYHIYFDSGKYCFIEWPEKIEALLPDDVLNLYIDIQADQSRTIRFGSDTLVN